MAIRLVSALACLSVLIAPAEVVRGQEANPQEATIDAMRQLGSISPVDQQRISEWLEWELNDLRARVSAMPPDSDKQRLAAVAAFRARIRNQASHPRNSAAFAGRFASELAGEAARWFSRKELDKHVGIALALSLVELDRRETIDGFVGGLSSEHPSVRYLCAKGLVARQADWAADEQWFQSVVSAVRSAALNETSPVALGRMYLALSVANRASKLAEVFLEIFDHRLSLRRGEHRASDGAEMDAFEFWARSEVLSALQPEQRQELARRLAVFLRLDAERYQEAPLSAEERIRLEVMMVAAESILAAVVSGQKATIDDILQNPGENVRQRVLDRVYEWVGNATSKTGGVLNGAPWNVPIGAP